METKCCIFCKKVIGDKFTIAKIDENGKPISYLCDECFKTDDDDDYTQDEIVLDTLDIEKVNSPQHYNTGNIECIDYIEDCGFGEAFCLGNAIKYIARANHKGSKLEDLKKARWYLNRTIEKLEKE